MIILDVHNDRTYSFVYFVSINIDDTVNNSEAYNALIIANDDTFLVIISKKNMKYQKMSLNR